MYEIKRGTNLQPERTKTKQIIKWTESEAGAGLWYRRQGFSRTWPES